MDELPYDIKYLILKRYIKDLNIRILFGNLKTSLKLNPRKASQRKTKAKNKENY